MQRSVYHSQRIQAWEQRWFAQQNSALGLMQQAAWTISQQFIEPFNKNKIQGDIYNIRQNSCFGNSNGIG